MNCIQHGVCLVLALFASGANAVTDPLRDRLITDARALVPATMSFDHATSVTKTSGASSETDRRVDHRSGKAWTLVSVNGKPPAVDAIAAYAKQANTAIAPVITALGSS